MKEFELGVAVIIDEGDSGPEPTAVPATPGIEGAGGDTIQGAGGDVIEGAGGD